MWIFIESHVSLNSQEFAVENEEIFKNKKNLWRHPDCIGCPIMSCCPDAVPYKCIRLTITGCEVIGTLSVSLLLLASAGRLWFRPQAVFPSLSEILQLRRAGFTHRIPSLQITLWDKRSERQIDESSFPFLSKAARLVSKKIAFIQLFLAFPCGPRLH